MRYAMARLALAYNLKLAQNFDVKKYRDGILNMRTTILKERLLVHATLRERASYPGIYYFVSALLRARKFILNSYTASDLCTASFPYLGASPLRPRRSRSLYQRRLRQRPVSLLLSLSG
jgi:hypothetical protein